MTRSTEKKTFESYAAQVQDKYGQRLYVIPGQEYVNCKSKLWHYCKIHKKAYLALPSNVTSTYGNTKCPECNVDSINARLYAKTISFVGQTSPDGHLILEHVGYRAYPSDIKLGTRGDALYRYQCSNCGDTEAVAAGKHLKELGNTPTCDKCRTKRESINSHRRNKERAMSPCQLYVCAIYFGDYIKIGISNDYDRRSTEHNRGNPYYDKDLTPEEHYKAGNIDLSYEDLHFLSDWHPRSWIFSVEQILLAATRDFIPKAPLPKEMLEACWTGQTELRVWQLEPKAVEAAFHKLIAEIQAEDGDWYKVYCRHINKLKIDPALCPYFVA